MSWFLLYSMFPLMKKSAANLLNVLLSLSEVSGGYSLLSTNRLISKYQGLRPVPLPPGNNVRVFHDTRTQCMVDPRAALAGTWTPKWQAHQPFDFPPGEHDERRSHKRN